MGGRKANGSILQFSLERKVLKATRPNLQWGLEGVAGIVQRLLRLASYCGGACNLYLPHPRRNSIALTLPRRSPPSVCRTPGSSPGGGPPSQHTERSEPKGREPTPLSLRPVPQKGQARTRHPPSSRPPANLDGGILALVFLEGWRRLLGGLVGQDAPPAGEVKGVCSASHPGTWTWEGPQG